MHVPAPFIDRKLELHFQGDWGWANLHRICGWLASEVLAHGAPGTRIAVWTGGAGIDAVEDAVFYEAFMTPYWKNYADGVDLNFIPIEDDVLDRLEQRLGWRRRMVPAGYQRRLDVPLNAVDFSDFLVIVRDDLAEDVAYLLAWAMCETKEILERQYRHIPPERSSVTWPLDPVKIAATSIPLHPGAARYYREAGIIGTD